jgi:hypothetical protein
MEQQTALDYYSKQIGKLTADLVTGRITGKQFVMLEIKLIKQAKEMEKEQMIEFGAKCLQSQNETYGGNK